MKKPTLISTFCGCGGSSLGYERAGFDVRLAVDWWDEALEWHTLNRPGVPTFKADITKVKGVELLRRAGLRRGGLAVLDGSPPCQGFSTANKNRVPLDPRNSLPLHWARLVLETAPAAAVMENVASMASRTMRFVLGMVTKTLRKGGYNCAAGVLPAADYGVAQIRRRLYLVAVRAPAVPSLPAPTAKRRITVQEALEGLKPGPGEIRPMQPSRLVHFIGRRRAKYSLSRQRDKSYAPSYTITAVDTWPIHPTEMRMITVREAARIMGFPDDWKHPENRHTAARLMGNAVPPPLAEAVGRHVRGLLRGKV